MTSKTAAALLRGASRGDADAMIRLSAMYLYGRGVARDLAEALRWARAAADAGSRKGAYMAGMMLLSDSAGLHDGDALEQARTLLAKAADGGYGPALEAVKNLAPAGKAAAGSEAPRAEPAGSASGGAESAGQSGDRLAACRSSLEARADAGDAGALFMQGWALMTGDRVPGVAKDPARGARLFEEAAGQGYAPAQLALAQLLLAGGELERNAERGAYWLDKAAQSADALVLAGAGAMYRDGCGDLQPDAAKAYACLRRAADLGSPEALYSVALMLAEGRGTVKDPAKAARFARKAAGQGVVLAQHFLGDCYCRGEGVAASMKTAFFWYEKAARAGVKPSRMKVALMLADGQGCRKNVARAREMLEELAAGGDARAKVMLARLLCGLGGEDKAGGMATLRSMAEAGDGLAQAELAELLLDAGAGARDEARAWLEKASAQGEELADRLLERHFGADAGQA